MGIVEKLEKGRFFGWKMAGLSPAEMRELADNCEKLFLLKCGTIRTVDTYIGIQLFESAPVN